MSYESSGGELGADGRLRSDLWVDQPGAAQHVERWRNEGSIDPELGDALLQFVDQGYMKLDLGLSDEQLARFDAEIESFWRDKPSDLAFAQGGGLRPLSSARDDERGPACRLADIHSHSHVARELYLHPRIHQVVRIVLQTIPVATQSLYFEYGSVQPLHRDPVYVRMRPACHLLAAWVALEDISVDAGPLTYVPGSHRLPYYQFSPGAYLFNHFEYGDAEALAMAQFELDQVHEAGLSAEPFLAKKGEVLFWHHSLLHGGSPQRDRSATRKSFVVHFTSMGAYERAAQTIESQVDGEKLTQTAESYELLAENRCYGFDAPMAVMCRQA